MQKSVFVRFTTVPSVFKKTEPHFFAQAREIKRAIARRRTRADYDKHVITSLRPRGVKRAIRRISQTDSH